MMNKGCSSRLINSSCNRHRVSLAEWLSSGFITVCMWVGFSLVFM
jgi:hypothetical protein